MRYGLESYLPLGAFEHCGNRHIKLYGGGGSWNPVTIVSNAVSSVGDAVSSATQAVGKAASDVGNVAVTVAKQAGDVVVNDIKTIGDVGTNLAHGQIGGALKTAVGGFIGDVSILTGGKAQTNQTLGAPNSGASNSGNQTITTGQSQQAPTSLNSQSILGAPGVTGSLTTRTISGPDNTYKIDKMTMLGL